MNELAMSNDLQNKQGDTQVTKQEMDELENLKDQFTAQSWINGNKVENLLITGS